MSDHILKGKFFAWVRGVRGLTPVLYHDGITATEGKTVQVAHPISAEELDWSFQKLAMTYPAPVIDNLPAWPDFGGFSYGDTPRVARGRLSATITGESGIGEQPQNSGGTITEASGVDAHSGKI